MTTDQKLGTAELLYRCAGKMGLQPTWLIPGRLLCITTPLGERYLYDAKSTLNAQLASNLTRNKLMTRLILERRGLPGIPYCNPKDLTEAEQFLARHAKIIVKPLTGSNSHDVHIVEAPQQLHGRNLSDYLLEKYIAGKELRYLVLNDQVIGVHESRYGQSVSETRQLERISYPESAWDRELVALALKTAKILQLRYAAIDYLIGPQGKIHILEVNSSPGMKWFHAPTNGPVVDVARLFLEAMPQDSYVEALPPPSPLVTSSVQAYSKV